MTYFIRSNGVWHITDSTRFDVREKLDAINYTLQFNSHAKEYYLIEAEEFVVPAKIYGSLFKHTDRIFNTFNDREKSTGVLLHGEKGSGKTLLSQHICQTGNSYGMPVVMINQPFISEATGNNIQYFVEFLQKMNQPCILLFDEFEKNFNELAQENILLTLDGTKFNKMLFLFVCNLKIRMSNFLFNRPGRIYYKLNFTGLQEDFIKEYCEDVLINKSIIKQVVNISSAFRNLNFDMLKAIVEEINRYGESPVDAIKLLNLDLNPQDKKHRVYLVTNNEEVLLDSCSYNNPFFDNYYIESYKLKDFIKPEDLEQNDLEEDNYYISLSPDKLVKVDAISGIFVYNVNGLIIKLVEEKTTSFNFNAI